MKYVGDPIINIVITLLFIIGGLGFTVLIDLRNKRKWKKLSLHLKLMILGTLLLNTVSMAIILLLKMDNPKTLGGLDWSEKLWGAYFQGVSPRTAGFNTIDLTAIKDSTAFYMMMLMFVGAGIASTGGGIKLTTFFIISFVCFYLFKRKRRNSYIKKSD
jgi:trk system potassium uptake protein